MSAFVDTNILVRHLTGEPPDMAARATAYLAAESDLLLTDLVVAETVYVLESFYEAPRQQTAEAIRSLLAFNSVVGVDSALLLRAIEVHETTGSTLPRRTSWRALRAPASTRSPRSTGRSIGSAPWSAPNRPAVDPLAAA